MKPILQYSSPLLVAATIISSTCVSLTVSSNLQIVDMYRALERPPEDKESFKLENNNLADIVGTLRYVHQEIIVEHAVAQPDREKRKYGVNGVGRYRMKVLNPNKLGEEKQPIWGFAAYGAFDFGVSTNLDVLKEFVATGDEVGAAKEDGPHLNYTRPGYWYSVSGQCPNLPWTCVPGTGKSTGQMCKETPPTHPALCLEQGCRGKEEGKKCKEVKQFTDVDDEDNLRKCCLHYEGGSGSVIKGGRCEKESEDPTGKEGCVYNYNSLEPKDYINLDELAGITSMKCWDENDKKKDCKDWNDWRQNCVDPDGKYKKMFKKNCTGDDCSSNEIDNWIVETQDFCVEYDLHPVCHATEKLCEDPQCMSLTTDQKELGLDFWKGKCDALANRKRAEKMAVGFFPKEESMRSTHIIVDQGLWKENPPCSAAGNKCTPNGNGGPYCTRAFAGVCSTCYIPGTREEYPAAGGDPVCPFIIKKEKGFSVPANTKCKTNDPEDLCCLYHKRCRVKGSAEDIELSVKGFLVVLSKQDLQEMLVFAERLLKSEGLQISDKDGFANLVHEFWDIQPPVSPRDTYLNFINTLREEAVKPQTSTTAVIVDPTDKDDDPNNTMVIAAVAVVILLCGVSYMLFGGGKQGSRETQRASDVELSAH
eukprot:TRINITY_DN17264_c0_g1_i1.p1 TRINITY_DN17264_c0_g1~~TRINITY_DN17264_c0_g1_i1.p1  ORF type:complete len:648 (-),score=105.89 TRINITY_DN17264_c0_g1_i1:392-2335(-)